VYETWLFLADLQLDYNILEHISSQAFLLLLECMSISMSMRLMYLRTYYCIYYISINVSENILSHELMQLLLNLTDAILGYPFHSHENENTVLYNSS
jgi:hypothetical protein